MNFRKALGLAHHIFMAITFAQVQELVKGENINYYIAPDRPVVRFWIAEITVDTMCLFTYRMMGNSSSFERSLS